MEGAGADLEDGDLSDSLLKWFLMDEQNNLTFIGYGNFIRVPLEEGEYTFILRAYDTTEELYGEDSITITIVDNTTKTINDSTHESFGSEATLEISDTSLEEDSSSIDDSKGGESESESDDIKQSEDNTQKSDHTGISQTENSNGKDTTDESEKETESKGEPSSEEDDISTSCKIIANFLFTFLLVLSLF
jgi:hypothetical protein